MKISAAISDPTESDGHLRDAGVLLPADCSKLQAKLEQRGSKEHNMMLVDIICNKSKQQVETFLRVLERELDQVELVQSIRDEADLLQNRPSCSNSAAPAKRPRSSSAADSSSGDDDDSPPSNKKPTTAAQHDITRLSLEEQIDFMGQEADNANMTAVVRDSSDLVTAAVFGGTGAALGRALAGPSGLAAGGILGSLAAGIMGYAKHKLVGPILKAMTAEHKQQLQASLLELVGHQSSVEYLQRSEEIKGKVREAVKRHLVEKLNLEVSD